MLLMSAQIAHVACFKDMRVEPLIISEALWASSAVIYRTVLVRLPATHHFFNISAESLRTHRILVPLKRHPCCNNGRRNSKCSEILNNVALFHFPSLSLRARCRKLLRLWRISSQEHQQTTAIFLYAPKQVSTLYILRGKSQLTE